MIPRPNSLLALALAAVLSIACVRPDQERRKESSSQPSAPASPARASSPAPSPHRGSAQPSAPGEAARDEAGAIVPVSGEDLLLRLRRGGHKATLVNVWASWCGPCKDEFPMLVGMKDKLAKLGVDLVFVSVDEPETQPAARTFASEHGMMAELLVAERPLGPFKRALNPEWPGMLPATFLFDAAGGLRHFWGGPVYENEIMPTLEAFLAGKPIDEKTLPGLSPGLDFRETPP